MNTAEQDRVVRDAVAATYGMTDDPSENERRIAQADAFVDAAYRAMRAETEGAVRDPWWRRVFPSAWLVDAPPVRRPMIFAGASAAAAIAVVGLVIWTISSDHEFGQEQLRGGAQTQRLMVTAPETPSSAAASLARQLAEVNCEARVDRSRGEFSLHIAPESVGCAGNPRVASLLSARGLTTNLSGAAHIVFVQSEGR